MKKHRLILLIGLVLCVSLAAACSIPVSVSGERALSEARQSYRDASLVVRGTCLQVHTDADGSACCDVSVAECIAGSAQTGDLLHCPGAGLKEGGEYLLYLSDGEAAPYAEDMPGYTLLGDSAMQIEGGLVRYGNRRMLLSDLKRDIRTLDAVVNAPANVYYYDTLQQLAGAADEIFIGKVTSLPEAEETTLRSQSGGATVEHKLQVSKAAVTAYGGIKGAIKYGDSVSVIYAPAMSADLVNAATLQAVPYGEKDAPSLKEGGIYLFFLQYSPDVKQSYLFAVNPMQGYAELEGDTLRVEHVNHALADGASLDALVERLRTMN